MIRRALIAGAVLLSLASGVYLLRDARAALRRDEPVASTLARYAADAPGVVIVFQPEDCLGDGTIVRRWNALAAAPGFRTTGLVIGKGGVSSAQKKVFTETGLKLTVAPISAVDAGVVAGKLGYTATPFAVVLDAGGRVAASFPAGQNIPPDMVATLVSGS
jgi:hypothetical protein